MEPKQTTTCLRVGCDHTDCLRKNSNAPISNTTEGSATKDIKICSNPNCSCGALKGPSDYELIVSLGKQVQALKSRIAELESELVIEKEEKLEIYGDIERLFEEEKEKYDHWLSPIKSTMLYADFGLAVMEYINSKKCLIQEPVLNASKQSTSQTGSI
jgi:hypothetical protein